MLTPCEHEEVDWNEVLAQPGEEEPATVGLDDCFGTWGIKDFVLPLAFMNIPEVNAEVLLPSLRLGSGEGEEVELAKLHVDLKDLPKELGVCFDAAGERRLGYHISVLRTQHAWLKRERASCIEWNKGKT